MNIEITDEVAQKLAGDVLMQNYIRLRDDQYYYHTLALKSLLDAFKLVIEYSTTEQERKAHGLLGAETMTGENETQ